MIYGLTADTSHITEEDVYDADLIEFDRFADATFFDPRLDYHAHAGAPAVIELVGDLGNAAWLDHLFTAPVGLLLVSRRMVRVLTGVAPFRHRLIPAVIYASSIAAEVRDPHTRRRIGGEIHDPALRNDDFVILQLVDTLDCLDRERTMVRGVPFHRCGEELLAMEEAEHLELRAPEGGFPPVFFVPELLYYAFSEGAKQACDEAGLKGLWWRPQR